MTHTCSKGWGARCPASKGPRCKCRCGGYNHGNPKARPDHDAGDDTLPLTPYKVYEYGIDETPERPEITSILVPDERVIRFERIGEDGKAQVVLQASGGDAPLPRRIVKHSPTGFEFGYAGSGPADTALNILCLVLPPKEANHLYQSFKFAFIGGAKHGDTLPLRTVRDWIAEQYAAEIEADEPQGGYHSLAEARASGY